MAAYLTLAVAFVAAPAIAYITRGRYYIARTPQRDWSGRTSIRCVICEHHFEAEDMAQEVFVQVFKAIDQFRGDSKLSTWLYRITVNICKNRVKYLSRRHSDTQDALEPIVGRYLDRSGAQPAWKR